MEVLSYIQSGITILAAIGIYIYLVASVYPWLTMRPAPRKKFPLPDRGLTRVKFPEGRGMICEPDLAVRRYVPRYALLVRDGKKYIRLQVHERVNYIRYDVLAFDRRGRLLDVLEVAERLASEGATRAVRLPAATAYARVIPRKVDGEYVGEGIVVGYSVGGTIAYAALTVVTTVLVGYLLHGEVAYLLENLTTPLGGTLLRSALLGILTAGWMVLMHYRHAARKINR
jgi:hypothetical protein